MTSPEASPQPTGFANMLATLALRDGVSTICLPADWLQGRTAYGGLSAALCLQACQNALPELPPLRSAQFAFMGPATGDLQITPVMLRQGKSAAFVGVDLVGDSGLAVRATLCFGAGRDLPHDVTQLPMPAAAGPDACPNYYAWQPLANFMAHFDGRLAAGCAPLSGGAAPQSLVWLRHRDATAPPGIVSLVALADALPPVAFANFTEAVPISTMTWTVDLLDADLGNPAGWWLVHGLAERISEGYSAQTTVIWHPDGRPVVSARQQVAIFARR